MTRREERWTSFSVEGVKFPSNTIDVVKRGEDLANFERELIIHFQRISKAAPLYAKALLGGVRRALEIYRRLTNGYDWVTPAAEEMWHNHAEGYLSAARKSMNIAPEVAIC